MNDLLKRKAEIEAILENYVDNTYDKHMAWIKLNVELNDINEKIAKKSK